jgi:hypothetical protein
LRTAWTAGRYRRGDRSEKNDALHGPAF